MGSDYISPIAALLDTLFSIHAPCVGSVNVEIGSLDRFGISIHAPRMGSDQTLLHGFNFKEFSILAPRMGSDFRLLHL